MPADTPDLDTLDLPGLLALWAERPNDPKEVYCLADMDGLEMHRNVFFLCTDDGDDEITIPHADGSVFESDLWLVEGHARACIERTGYGVWINTFPPGARKPGERVFATAIRDGRHLPPLEAFGTSLAGALVRLRLSLPKPATTDPADR